MTDRSMRMSNLLLALALGGVLAPGGALAHSHQAPGEHMEEFHKHIDDYENDVRGLVERLDTIAAQYRASKDVSRQADALIEAWEEVAYHEALEHKAPVLYPPIWQAVIALKEAVNSNAAPDEVARLARQAAVALHEGMGGLKVKAQMAASGEADTHEAETEHGPGADTASTMSRIDTLLNQAVEAYAGGDGNKAKALIHEAYMDHFEGTEGALIEQDPSLVSRLEADFNAELPSMIDSGASPDAVREEIEEIQELLDEAEQLLKKAEQDKPKVF